MAELRWEPSVKETEIGVTVKDGVVTLSGDVGSFQEKSAAERAVGRVSGVRAVAEEIKVELLGTHKRTDEDIAQAAANTLDWHTSVPIGRVKVKVQNGWTTLTGEVDWLFQKTVAADAVRNLPGVINVNNQIIVKPTVKPQYVNGMPPQRIPLPMLELKIV